MTVYYKTFKVPVWVIVGGSPELVSKVTEWLDAASARRQDWPTNTFMNKLISMKGRGFGHYFQGDQISNPSFDLLCRAGVEHLKEALNNPKEMTIEYTASRFDRNITTPEDASVWLNSVLTAKSDVSLSAMFRIAELSHNENAKRYKAWYTTAPCGVDIIRRLADKVVIIGDSPKADLDLSDMKSRKSVSAALESFFQGL